MLGKVCLPGGHVEGWGVCCFVNVAVFRLLVILILVWRRYKFFGPCLHIDEAALISVPVGHGSLIVVLVVDLAVVLGNLVAFDAISGVQLRSRCDHFIYRREACAVDNIIVVAIQVSEAPRSLTYARHISLC